MGTSFVKIASRPLAGERRSLCGDAVLAAQFGQRRRHLSLTGTLGVKARLWRGAMSWASRYCPAAVGEQGPPCRQADRRDGATDAGRSVAELKPRKECPGLSENTPLAMLGSFLPGIIYSDAVWDHFLPDDWLLGAPGRSFPPPNQDGSETWWIISSGQKTSYALIEDHSLRQESHGGRHVDSCLW